MEDLFERPLENLLENLSENLLSMLTACWQQALFIPGQHSNCREFVHDDPLWRRPVVDDRAAADTMVAAAPG
jgi:hypothetical protein